MQEATSVRKLKINIPCMKAHGSGVGFVLPSLLGYSAIIYR